MQEAFDPISEACWGPGWWWPWGAEQWGMQMTTTQKKRWLMVITVLSCLNYILLYYSQDCSAAESTKDAPKDRTTLVVFIGLLIDLLGEKKLSKWPQCTIVFLFSFHPDSASLSCSDWPLQRKWFQWFVRIFGDQGTFFQFKAGL